MHRVDTKEIKKWVDGGDGRTYRSRCAHYYIMIGYLINTKVGAKCYNIFHTYSLSITIVIVGLLLTDQLVLAVGLIWSAHIGMDRAIGYGLKYSTNFKDTHLNRV